MVVMREAGTRGRGVGGLVDMEAGTWSGGRGKQGPGGGGDQGPIAGESGAGKEGITEGEGELIPCHRRE